MTTDEQRLLRQWQAPDHIINRLTDEDTIGCAWNNATYGDWRLWILSRILNTDQIHSLIMRILDSTPCSTNPTHTTEPMLLKAHTEILRVSLLNRHASQNNRDWIITEAQTMLGLENQGSPQATFAEAILSAVQALLTDDPDERTDYLSEVCGYTAIAAQSNSHWLNPDATPEEEKTAYEEREYIEAEQANMVRHLFSRQDINAMIRLHISNTY